MTQADMIADMERRAALVGVPMYLVCQRAGVAPTTFYRWQEGAEAKLATLNRVKDAVAAIEAERLAA